MAERSDARGEVTAALAQIGGSAADLPEDIPRSERAALMRMEALTLRMAGISYERIAERLQISEREATNLVRNALRRAERQTVEEKRALENEAYDKLQSVYWAKALSGDLKAFDAVMKLSRARRELNGLDAPQKMEVSIGVRTQMQQALTELENLMLGDVVEGEVEEDADGRPVGDGEAGRGGAGEP